MCYFTQVTYQCGHIELRTSPEDTFLCEYAQVFGLSQSLDSAPASCFPLNDIDVTNDKIIGTKNRVFHFCDSCYPKCAEITADRKGMYNLGLYIQQGIRDFTYYSTSFRTNKLLRNKLSCFKHLLLRDTLGPADDETLKFLFRDQLVQCAEWTEHLKSYIKQGVPQSVLDSFFGHITTEAEEARQRLHIFTRIVETLRHYCPSSSNYKDTLIAHGDHLKELVDAYLAKRPGRLEIKKPHFSPFSDLQETSLAIIPKTGVRRPIPLPPKRRMAKRKPNLTIMVSGPMRAEHLPAVNRKS